MSSLPTRSEFEQERACIGQAREALEIVRERLKVLKSLPAFAVPTGAEALQESRRRAKRVLASLDKLEDELR